MSRHYKLAEVAAITKISLEKLKMDSKRGKLPTLLIYEGKKPVRVITAETLETLLGNKGQESYETLIASWRREMLTGVHVGLDGSPVTEGYVENLEWGFKKYWQVLDVTPSIEGLNIESWRAVYMHYKPNEKERRDYYSTKMHIYKVLCSFMTFLVKQGYRSQAALDEIRALRPSPMYKPKRHSMPLSEIWEAINFNAVWHDGRTTHDILTLEMLLFLYGFAGLRRMEAADIEIADVNFETQEIRVHGKGGKDRIVPMPNELSEKIGTWLRDHRPESALPYVLLNAAGNQLTERGITLRFSKLSHAMRVKKAKSQLAEQEPALWQKLSRSAQKQKAESQAKTLDFAVRPHDMRRAYARLLHDQGMPMRDIQEILGHSKIETTEKYVIAQQKQSADWVRKHFNIRLPELSQAEELAPQQSREVFSSVGKVKPERQRKFRY